MGTLLFWHHWGNKIKKLAQTQVNLMWAVTYLLYLNLLALLALYYYHFYLYGTFVWTRGFIAQIIFTSLIIFFGQLLLFASTFSLKINCIFINLLTFASFINYQKYLYRREVLVPADFLQIKEALSITWNSVPLEWTPALFFLMMFIILSFIPLFFLAKIAPHWRVRILIFFLTPIIIIPFAGKLNYYYVEQVPVTIYDNRVEVYQKRGLVLGFINEIPLLFFQKPANYSRKTVEAYYQEWQQLDQRSAEQLLLDKATTAPEKMNLILILNESYTDPTLLKNITYSLDPLGPVREVMSDFGYLNFVSVQEGGGTANVEYEVLTGVSISMFAPNAIIFQQYLNRPHASLATYLKQKGFYTLGLHPYEKWFWRREHVYPFLGFDEFIAMDQMYYQDRVGPYINDQSLTQEIIARYQEHSEQSLFISAISMQNHGAYHVQRYEGDNLKVEIKNQDLEEEFKAELTEYVNGVYDASLALADLIAYFQTQATPTYIMMYGDHLPFFGAYQQDYYRLLGYDEEHQETIYHRYTTPIIFWTNQDKEPLEKDDISPFLFNQYILPYIGLPLEGYYDLLAIFHQYYKVISREFSIDSAGHIIIDNHLDNPLLQKLNLLAYDLFFGKSYLTQLMTEGADLMSESK